MTTHAQIMPLWDSLIATARTINQHNHTRAHFEGFAYKAVAGHVRPSSKGDGFAIGRLVQDLGPAIEPHLADLRAGLAAFQQALLPYPILGAQWMEIRLYHDGPLLWIGPWGKYLFHAHRPGVMDAIVSQMITIALRDGTTGAHTYTPNVASGRPITARDPAHVRALFELFQEDSLCHTPTGVQQQAAPGQVPVAGPLALPATLWSDLWSALAKARSAGVRSGTVDAWPAAAVGQHTTTLSSAEVSPSLAKKLGGADTTYADPLPPALASMLEPVRQAVEALIGACRHAAPVLASLDGWHIPAQVHERAHLYAPEQFSWGPKAQSLMLLGARGPWKGPHPVRNCNEAVFQYTLERALGALATCPASPDLAWKWQDDYLGETLLPAPTATEAMVLQAALACGNKPAFAPGAPLTKTAGVHAPWQAFRPFP